MYTGFKNELFYPAAKQMFFFALAVYIMYTTSKESYLTIQLDKRNVFNAMQA
jgi:hypothetical protein